MDDIYKHKYLKYKAKYMALQSGGANKYIILARLEDVKDLLPAFEKKVESKQRCADMEKRLIGKSHVYKQSHGEFREVNDANHFCGASKILTSIKQNVNPVLSGLKTEVMKTAKELSAQLAPEIQKLTESAKEKIKQESSALLKEVKTSAMDFGKQLAPELNKLKDEALEKGKLTIQQKTEQAMKFARDRIQKGGDLDDVKKELNSVGINNPDMEKIKDIIEKNKYDIVIKYEQNIIPLRPSSFVVTKLK